jgi:hypothetical protein
MFVGKDRSFTQRGAPEKGSILARYERSSLFYRSVSDKEKKICKLTPVPNIIKPFTTVIYELS